MKTFKLGSIVVKVTKSGIAVKTLRAERAERSAKRSAARVTRRLRNALNNARLDRQEAGDALDVAQREIDSLKLDRQERGDALEKAMREIDSLKDSLKAWEEGNAVSVRAEPRRVKRSSNPSVTAARVETLHRNTDW